VAWCLSPFSRRNAGHARTAAAQVATLLLNALYSRGRSAMLSRQASRAHRLDEHDHREPYSGDRGIRYGRASTDTSQYVDEGSLSTR
jgi:hypothetical protein